MYVWSNHPQQSKNNKHLKENILEKVPKYRNELTQKVFLVEIILKQKGNLVCLAKGQISQTLFEEKEISGTKSARCFIGWMEGCPRRLCHKSGCEDVWLT